MLENSRADDFRAQKIVTRKPFQSPPETMGPLTAPATWKSGTFSRKRENIAEAPFIVLDFDKIPTTVK